MTTREDANLQQTSGTNIHLNEEDWLHLLQKLTPSSLDNLQQTLKRIEHHSPTLSSDGSIPTSSLTPSVSSVSLTPTTTSEVSQICSVTSPTSMADVKTEKPLSSLNTIVLPSSTLLLAPTGGFNHSTVALETCAPGLNRLMLTSGSLLGTSAVPTSTATAVNENLCGLNTLASAAVALAAGSGNQLQWTSQEPSNATTHQHPLLTTATTAPIQTQVTSALPIATAFSNYGGGSKPSAHTVVISPSPNRSTTDLPSSAQTSVYTPFDPNLLNQLNTTNPQASGLTVYPIQITANGPTFLLTASQPAMAATNRLANSQGLRLVSATQNTSNSLVTHLPSCLSSSLIVPPTSNLVLPSSRLTVTTTSANTSLISTSTTPINKPRFKALLETSSIKSEISGGMDVITPDPPSSNSSADSLSIFSPPCCSAAITVSCPSSAISSPSTSNPTPDLLRLTQTRQITHPVQTDQQHQQQSVFVVQAPKRPAESDGDPKSPDLGTKRLLLVCSQPTKPMVGNNMTTFIVTEANTNNTKNLPTSSVGMTLIQQSPSKPPATTTTSLPRHSTMPTARLFSCKPDILPKESTNTVPVVDEVDQMVHNIFDSFAHQQQQNMEREGVGNIVRPALAPAYPRTEIRNFSKDDIVSAAVSAKVKTLLHNILEESNKQPILLDEPVGEDEARRRAKRRERNRVAAARCRQRRQDQIVDLQHRVGTLMKIGEELKSTLKSLDFERARLESLVRSHGSAGCEEATVLLENLNHSTNLPSALHNLDQQQSSALTNRRNVVSLDDLIRQSSNVSSASSSSIPLSIGVTPTSTNLIVFNPSANGTQLTTLGAANGSGAAFPNEQVGKLNLSQTVAAAASRPASFIFSLPAVQSTMKCSSPPAITVPNGDLTATVKDSCASNAVTSTPTESATSVFMSGDLASLTTSVSRSGVGATRPSTLLPFKPESEVSKTSSVTPTPLFWPSELQNFSPILTPTTWKLLSSLTNTTNTNINNLLPSVTVSSGGSASGSASILMSPVLQPQQSNPNAANLLAALATSFIDGSKTSTETARQPVMQGEMLANTTVTVATDATITTVTAASSSPPSSPSSSSCGRSTTTSQNFVLSFENCDKPTNVHPQQDEADNCSTVTEKGSNDDTTITASTTTVVQ